MREKSKLLTADNIFEITNGGEFIFEKEIGKISYTQNIKSPLRKENDPSFRLKKNSRGIVYGHDFGGNQWSGNGIELIKELYGLSFLEAIQKIAMDFGLTDKTIIVQRKLLPIQEVKPPTVIEFNIIPFTERHLKYWEKSKIPETFLNSKNIWAISKYAINKKVFNIPSHQYCFAYYAEDIDKTKILTLGNNVKLKWMNTASNSYLWNYSNLKDKDCNEVWVCKSYKDAVLMEYHFGKCILACQNESHKMIMQNKDKIENVSNNVILLYGADKQAFTETKNIEKDTGWKSFHTPYNLYKSKGIEDPFAYVEEYGIDSLRTLLKQQNYL